MSSSLTDEARRAMRLLGTLGYRTIEEGTYQQLVKDSNELEALYAGGVDNWGGFEEALGNAEDDGE